MLIIASQNSGKIHEFQTLLADFWPAEQIKSIGEIKPDFVAPAEAGATFSENALLKARAVAQATGQVALADDSGLTVTALGDFPGVHSARWLSGSDAQRTAGILQLLDLVFASQDRQLPELLTNPSSLWPDQEFDLAWWQTCLQSTGLQPAAGRRAAYQIALAYVDPVTNQEQVFTGRCDGELALAPRGEHGFGYDPIFMPTGYAPQTFGELSGEVKNKISHRAQALAKLTNYLAQK